jgi:hypothetical protein
MQNAPVNSRKTWAAASGAIAVAMLALIVLIAGLENSFPLLGFIGCILTLAAGLTGGSIILSRVYTASTNPEN